MDGIHDFWTFFVSSLVFAVTPGLDTILVLNRSLLRGRDAGVFSALGIAIGVVVHTLFAAFGLSMLVARSAVLFSAVKYAGAAYLLWMGATALLTPGGDGPNTVPERLGGSAWRYLLSGLTTNLLNPKVILFFLAFFPQFVRRESVDDPAPFLILGGTYAAIQLAWLFAISAFCSLFSEKLLRRRGFRVWMNRIAGGVFVLMGIKVAAAE